MTKLLRIVDPGFVSLKGQLTLCHLGEKVRQSQPRECNFVDKSIVHKHWSLIDRIFDKIWPRKNDSNKIIFIPELGTSGGAAVHNPNIARYRWCRCSGPQMVADTDGCRCVGPQMVADTDVCRRVGPEMIADTDGSG